MALIAPKQDQSQRELPKIGNKIARCWMVCDLGLHEGEWQGEKNISHKVKIAWELPKDLMTQGDNAGKPFSVMQDYTLSMGKKANLRQAIESWLGSPINDDEALNFDITKLVGMTCLLNLFHNTSKNGNTYANINNKGKSISPMFDGVEVPEMINKPIIFSLQDMEGREGTSYSDLPDWLKKCINTNAPKNVDSDDFAPESTYNSDDDNIPGFE